MRPSEKFSLDKLQIGDVSQNGRGGKSASLSVIEWGALAPDLAILHDPFRSVQL